MLEVPATHSGERAESGVAKDVVSANVSEGPRHALMRSSAAARAAYDQPAHPVVQMAMS